MSSFPKSAKLCGQLRIQSLYKEGRRFSQWPLRVSYRPVEAPETRVLIWAPKSLFKHAVDRNRLRRLMREAYRAEQHLLEPGGQHYEIAFNYMDRAEQPLAVIERATRKALTKIAASSSRS